MTIKALAIAVTLALGVFSPGAFAQTSADPAPEPVTNPALPAPLSETLSDFADVLDPAAEGRIAGQLAAVRAETGVQMVVVTLPSIDSYGGAGQRLDAYAKALFNAWGVGDAERNDGIMMLVVSDAREVRIALGAGYDAVYDGRAARVLSTAVLPELREGRMEQGIEAGIASSRERLIAPFIEGRPVTLTDGFAEEIPSNLPWLGGAGAFGAAVIFLFWRSARARKLCPRCGEATLSRTREVIEPATLMSSGTGIEHQKCTSCGFVDRKQFRVGRSQSFGASRLGSTTGSSSGGSSRSGGFGGGRSSGGGASGKW
ncbi:MAG: TPM domain-containing protein [Rhodobacterales bacterium]|nr:MAG: TPM domain-containing protein [Rhodobacterales bacterium]